MCILRTTQHIKTRLALSRWQELVDSNEITVSVLQIHPPCNLSLSTKLSAGFAYTQDATFSLAITPSLDREMFSGSVDAGFVLALPFHHADL